MEKLTEKICTLCYDSFICNAADIFSCACYNLKLSEDIRKKIGEQYHDCLCSNCLEKINNDISLLPTL